MAKRAEEFAAREKALEQLVAAFHTATENAEKVRSGAQSKAAKLLSDAEEKAAALRQKAEADAAGFDAAAEAAVREILGAGETPEAAAQLTGWTVARVRQAQRSKEPAAVKRSADRVRQSATTAVDTHGEN
jgi:vacuolar-type H+-ATPase subunit H